MNTAKMTNFIRLTISCLTILAIISCERKENVSSEVSDKFRIVSKYDTLFITAEFGECGEWGGHIERLILTSDHDQVIKARLIVDSVSCEEIINKKDDSSGYIYSDLDDEERIILIDSTKYLSNDEEIVIASFIHRLVDLSLNPFYLNNNTDSIDIIYRGVANVIDLKNSNSNLSIHFRNIDNMYNPEYARTTRQLFSMCKN